MLKKNLVVSSHMGSRVAVLGAGDLARGNWQVLVIGLLIVFAPRRIVAITGVSPQPDTPWGSTRR